MRVCVRECSVLLQVCLHEAEVTRTSQKHAVRCDMYTLEELHAGRLWVTKYGRGNEGTEVREGERLPEIRRKNEKQTERQIKTGKEEMREPE